MPRARPNSSCARRETSSAGGRIGKAGESFGFRPPCVLMTSGKPESYGVVRSQPSYSCHRTKQRVSFVCVTESFAVAARCGRCYAYKGITQHPATRFFCGAEQIASSVQPLFMLHDYQLNKSYAKARRTFLCFFALSPSLMFAASQALRFWIFLDCLFAGPLLPPRACLLSLSLPE